MVTMSSRLGGSSRMPCYSAAASAPPKFGRRYTAVPSSAGSLALLVSITVEARPACNHSSADGRNGSRARTSDVTTAATCGTLTGRAPSASADVGERQQSVPGDVVRPGPPSWWWWPTRSPRRRRRGAPVAPVFRGPASAVLSTGTARVDAGPPRKLVPRQGLGQCGRLGPRYDAGPQHVHLERRIRGRLGERLLAGGLLFGVVVLREPSASERPR